MTWRDLAQPEYVLTFVRAFLIMALPVLGLGSFANGGPDITGAHVVAWPSGPMMLAALGGGILNGIQAVLSLRTPPPAPAPAVTRPP